MTFLTIGNSFIDPSKIVAMSNQDGRIYISITGGDTLDFTDAGTSFPRILDEWRKYLESRQALFNNSVEYGVFLAVRQGALCVS